MYITIFFVHFCNWLSCSRAKNLLTAQAATFPIRLLGQKQQKKKKGNTRTHTWKVREAKTGTKGIGDQSALEVLAKVVNCFYCQQHGTLFCRSCWTFTSIFGVSLELARNSLAYLLSWLAGMANGDLLTRLAGGILLKILCTEFQKECPKQNYC